MSEYSDGAVFERATRAVVLGGRTYTLVEPSRGLARRLRRRVVEVAQAAERAQQSGDVGAGVDATDLLLDLIYEGSAEVAADRERIEEEATEREILAAVRAMQELLNDPLASALPSPPAAPQEAAPPTST